MIQSANMELWEKKRRKRESRFEEIVKECFNRVEFRTAVTSGIASFKCFKLNEAEFKKQRRLFLEELEGEIQETWNEKKLSFTRR